MTDFYDEWWTQREAILQAQARGGRVLVTGLGLGLVAVSMLEAAGSHVQQVVAIERSADVIALVAPGLIAAYGGRLKVVCANAFEWLPSAGERYSIGWHDIWPNPHEPGVLAEAERLEQRFAPWCDWQGNWVREYRAAEQIESAV